MAGRLLPWQGLRSRLFFLSAAPSLLCLVVTVLGVGWLAGDQQRDRDEDALRAASLRVEMRIAELRGRLEGLGRLLSRDQQLAETLAADRPLDGALLRHLLSELQVGEPLIGGLELRVQSPGHPDRGGRIEEGCGVAGAACGAAGLPSVSSLFNVVLPSGVVAEARISAALGYDLAEGLAAAEQGALFLVVDGEARVSTIPLPAGPVTRWAPAWLLDALAEDHSGSGTLRIEGRNWLARSMPLPGSLPGGFSGTRPAILLLLPASAGVMAMDETLAMILSGAVLVLALSMTFAAGAARRLGGMLAALSEALRRLGRGDLAVPIPPAPPGAPREVIELTDACILFRDAAAERSRLSERLRWLANFDGLTGLPNRALLGDRLELAFAAAQRDGTGLVVLALDLDHFKEVNDTLGHAAGDEVLRVVAGRLRGCLRATDTLARIGGDEFVLVAPGLDAPEQLAAFAGRLLAVMEEPVPIASDHRSVGVSIGAAIMPPGRFDGRPEALLQDADLALYQAKAEGGSCLRVFEPAMDERLRTRRALVADLRNAMARQELTILFQPQVSTATRRITGAEALLRWHHPTRGLISPETFIPLAEQTGLIVPIGAWVLEQACHVARGWGDLHLAVNVSPLQVRQASFVATVEQALARSGLPPQRLELEITEAAMLANSAETLGILSRLRSLGVRLAMDDFGTGYSSLATLQRFRFDKIKVDRSFIRHLARDARAVALLRAVIALGSALDVTTNAEGVEDEGQLSLLRAEGCDEAQGYLFGRPMSAAEFHARVNRQDSRAA
ncbi:diguanylate cyclase (GGDEF) domain-containing protein [Roseomonas rosea]|uniref:Diguanylate cyclase (GGDEF) domain-containing protein n=1 Tax=Muricoccus roseus TaxID=198092 RepID=A0A1M6E4V3_9PROT|nr:EAL domain-containing protein [Roseomonas rosea]SHI80527.1 diguanylate cyclase (GGDEF) domain-containing protein [Roseomonas rosea]